MPARSGRYVLTAVTHTAGDADADNDAVSVTLLVGDVTATPADEVLAAMRPTVNPFSGSTGLSFSLGRSTDVRLEIFDARGRLVARLQDGELGAGPRILTWDGRDRQGREAPAGVYLYRGRLGSIDQAGKLLKVR